MGRVSVPRFPYSVMPCLLQDGPPMVGSSRPTRGGGPQTSRCKESGQRDDDGTRRNGYARRATGAHGVVSTSTSRPCAAPVPRTTISLSVPCTPVTNGRATHAVSPRQRDEADGRVREGVRERVLAVPEGRANPERQACKRASENPRPRAGFSVAPRRAREPLRGSSCARMRTSLDRALRRWL